MKLPQFWSCILLMRKLHALEDNPEFAVKWKFVMSFCLESVKNGPGWVPWTTYVHVVEQSATGHTCTCRSLLVQTQKYVHTCPKLVSFGFFQVEIWHSSFAVTNCPTGQPYGSLTLGIICALRVIACLPICYPYSSTANNKKTYMYLRSQ